MLELTPSFSAQTREAFKKLDANQDHKLTQAELQSLDSDGQAGLSEQELLAAGVAAEDIAAVQDNLQRKAELDPQGVVFELEDPFATASETSPSTRQTPAESTDSTQPIAKLLQNLQLNPAQPAQQESLQQLKGLFETSPSTTQPDSGNPNTIRFPNSSAPAEPSEAESHAEIYLRHICNNLPPEAMPDPAMQARLVAFVDTLRALPDSTQKRPDQDAIRALNRLLHDQRLTPSLMDSLEKLLDPSQTPLHSELEPHREALVYSALDEIAFPGSIAQEHKNTCAGTTCQKLLAIHEPQKYLQLIAGLASPTGEVPSHVFARARTALQREPGTLTDDKSGRTLTSRLIQPALMEYANDAQSDIAGLLRGSDYDNAHDRHSGIAGDLSEQWGQGLLQDDVSYLLNDLLAPEAYQSVIVEQPGMHSAMAQTFATGTNLSLDDSLSALNTQLQAGRPVPVSLRWSDNYHEVLLTRLDPANDRAYYLNPHGKPEYMSYTDFCQRLMAASLPNDQAPALPGSGDAMARLGQQGVDPQSYRPSDWYAYRTLDEQLNTDPDLVRVLSDEQKQFLLDHFEKLELPDSSLQEIMDILPTGRVTQAMLDRLGQTQDKFEAQKLLSLYNNLAHCPLPPATAQELLAAYPERNLSPTDFSELIMTLIDKRTRSSQLDTTELAPIQALIDKSRSQISQNLTGQKENLTQEQVLQRFESLSSAGSYEQISQLAALADAATKTQMINQLMQGWTRDRAEQAINAIITNATPAQQHEILSRLDLQRLGNETENMDRAADVFGTLAQAGFDQRLLDQHMQKFFAGLSSQSSIFNGTDDDAAAAFVRRLRPADIRALPDTIKMQFFRALDSGNTTEQEYACMRSLAAGSSSALKAQMVQHLMAGDTTAREETTMLEILRDAAAENASVLLDTLNRLDTRQLADELQDASQAAEAGALMAKAYQQSGARPIHGKLHDYLRTLAYQHRSDAIRAFISHPEVQANGRAVYKNLDVVTLRQMANYLMDGNTNGADEQAIMAILANTQYSQYGELMRDDAFRARLGDELDASDIARLDQWTAAYRASQRP